MDKPVPNSFLQKQVRLLPPPFQVCIDRGGKDVEVQKTFSPAVSWQLHGEVKEGMKDAGLSLGSLLMGHADEPSSSLRQGLGFSSGTKTCSLGELLFASRAALCGLQGDSWVERRLLSERHPLRKKNKQQKQ